MLLFQKFFGQAAGRVLWVGLLAGFFAACTPEVTDRKTPEVAITTMNQASVLPEGMAHTVMTPTQPGLATSTVPALDACLVGEWRVADLANSIADAYSARQAPLTLQAVEGETRYSFLSDGSLEIRFLDIITTLAGELEGKQIIARSLLAGSATADFHVEHATREIRFSNFGGDGIKFATEINGQVLAGGDFPAWRAFASNLAGGSPSLPAAGPTRVVEESTAVITCTDNSMRLQAISPVPGPEIQLGRIP